MTPTERKLNQLLRTVSETGTQEAPAHVEQTLRAAFRQRQNKRRNTRWAAVAIAAGLGGVALLRLTPTVSAPPAVPVVSQVAAAQQDTSEFIALADADTSTPLDHATIVRVRLPLSDFRDIGFAINEQNAAVRVQADVLLGQDGLARAVRFVQ